jgi:hypothetical protein
MRKCKNLVSGEVCDFFVYDVDVIPDWFVGYGVIGFGYYVNDNCGGIRMFNTSDRFAFFYEDVSELKDISTYTSVDSPPPTEDLLEKGREHVEAFNNRMDELKYTGICQDKESKGYYIYKVDGSSFCVYREKECYFTREFFHTIFYVVKEPDVDASFVGDTLEYIVRKCRPKYGHDGKMFDLFIYGQDKSPKWFDYKSLNEKQKDLLRRKGIGYVVNELYKKDKVFIFTHKTFMQYMEEIDMNAHAEYGSIERNDDGYTVKRPVDSGAYLSAEDVDAAGTKVHTDNWQKGLDEYAKKSDVSDIDRAEQWFNNLHPEVFKYIVLRDLNIDEMVRIYKKEISNL